MYFLIISIIIKIIQSQIILNFTENKNNSSTNTTSLYSQLYNASLETIIKLGNPEQKLLLRIEQQSYYLSISSNELSGNFIKFNYKNSKTYNYNKIKIYISEKYMIANQSSDILIFENNNLNNNITFLCVTEGKYFQTGTFGLFLKKDNKEITNSNILYQLKEKKLIKSYIFYIEYLNENKGKLFIGDYPHNFNKEKYKEINFKKTKEIIKNSNRFNIRFDKIMSGEKEIKDQIEGYFELENGLIRGTTKYHENIKINFFNQYLEKNICKTEIFTDNNLWKCDYYICEENINLNEFPLLNFTLYDANISFSFNANDLFFKYNHKYYFLIYFIGSYRIDWIFGKPFLKKYITVFDQEKNVIGFYEKIKDNNNRYSLIFIFINLLFFIFGGLIAFYIFKKLYHKRKIRANELDDDFVYESIDKENSQVKKEKTFLGLF